VEYRWKNYTTVYGKINIFVNAAILLNTQQKLKNDLTKAVK
jgi:hypothetical protein